MASPAYLDPAYQAQVLARADMLTVDNFARRHGLTRMNVDQRRCDGRLLGLSDGRVWYFPAWQIEPDVRGDPLARVLAMFKGSPPWAVYFFLTEPFDLIGGHRPLELVRAGEFSRLSMLVPVFLDRLAQESKSVQAIGRADVRTSHAHCLRTLHATRKALAQSLALLQSAAPGAPGVETFLNDTRALLAQPGSEPTGAR